MKIRVYDIHENHQDIECSDDGKMYMVGSNFYRNFNNAYNHARRLCDKKKKKNGEV